MKRLSIVLLVILALLAACAPGSTATVDCEQTVTVPVFDAGGNKVSEVTSGVLRSEYTKVATLGQPDYYVREAANPEEWAKFFSHLRAGVDSVNVNLERLYYRSESIFAPKLGPVFNFDPNAPGLGATPTASCDVATDPYWGEFVENGIRYDKFWGTCLIGSTSEYCTSSDISGGTVYVTVTSPGLSRVDYSYPTWLLNSVIAEAYGGSPVEFNPRYALPESAVDGQEYGELVLKTLLGDETQTEVASFTLVLSDYKGRHDIEPVIAKALEVSAVSSGRPATFVVRSLMSGGQYAAGYISAHQNAISIGGWMALTFGSVKGSGGDASLEGVYTTTYQDLVRGSIFMFPMVP